MSTEEKTAVVVFGTKEVSVKEFMGSEQKSLMLLSDYEKAKQNLLELKEKHEERVAELVALGPLTSNELKELNAIRAELREPRYLVQKIESNNISVFESYKKRDKANLKTLIDINKELEVKADDKIKLEEERKKREEKHSLYKNTFKTMVGVLTLDTWYGANQSKEKCPKCKTHMIYKYGFLLSDEYGCPGCGHTEGGEW